jgi:hypothetical protein
LTVRKKQITAKDRYTAAMAAVLLGQIINGACANNSGTGMYAGQECLGRGIALLFRKR